MAVIIVIIFVQTSVVFNMVSTGLDSHNFRNPEVFDPDRWNKKTTEDNITFTSLPFGFGPRMCYGISKLNSLTNICNAGALDLEFYKSNSSYSCFKCIH